MSNKSNKIKENLLGMTIGTASNRLKKVIMFHLARKLNEHTCYRCGHTIDDINEFSVEHKESWQQSENPLITFFDINNIAFSHHKCNVGAGIRPNKKFSNEKERIKSRDKRLNNDRTLKKKLWRKRRREAGLPYT